MSAWKPGDVAMVVCSDGEERRAIIGTRYLDDSPVFVFRDGKMRDPETTTARPLVVIDPEDAHQIARLADAFCLDRWSHIEGSTECDPLTRSSMQAALREFADPKPPKPDEPAGLGAVVVDADGVRWTRADSASPVGEFWFGEGPGWGTYEHIDAVTVLSEGVTQ